MLSLRVGDPLDLSSFEILDGDSPGLSNWKGFANNRHIDLDGITEGYNSKVRYATLLIWPSTLGMVALFCPMGLEWKTRIGVLGKYQLDIIE